MKHSERDEELIAEALRLLDEATENKEPRERRHSRTSKIIFRGWKRLAGM